MGLPINHTYSGVVVDGYCFTGWSQFSSDFVQGLAGETDGDSTFFNDGDTTPSPDNRIYPWLPSSFSGSNPPAFVYKYVNGVWIMPNPIPPGVVWMWTGLEADIPTLDGGEAGAITDTTGPMWEKLATMDGRFPLGPGTVNGVVVGVGAQGGAGTVTLIEENLPIHEIQGYSYLAGTNLATPGLIVDDDRSAALNGTVADSFGGDANGDTVAFPAIPPYTAIWFIKRTARRFYRR